jgi:hypothetical protein
MVSCEILVLPIPDLEYTRDSSRLRRNFNASRLSPATVVEEYQGEMRELDTMLSYVVITLRVMRMLRKESRGNAKERLRMMLPN